MANIATMAGVSDVHHIRKHDVESWHDLLCETFSQTAYMPIPTAPFSGELSHCAHGPARMSRIHSSAGRFLRSPQKIRADNFDGYNILLSLRGNLRLSQSDKALQARFGEALVYRYGAPFELEFPEEYWAVSLWVQPDLVQRHCPAMADRATTLLRPETTAGSLALTMIRELCVNVISRGAPDAARLVGATLDVISSAVEVPETTEGRRNGWMIGKLSNFVDRNLDNTALSVDCLAAEAGVSARSLNRALGALGTTPMRWVWDRRLERAYDALAAARVRNVTEAAYSFGFKDGAHFSRAFSRKYGVSPNAVLKRR